MIITNIHNIPETIYNAIVANIQRPEKDVMRVSELINPPLIKQLAVEHWDEIVVDASDFLWSILGSAVHYILKKGTPENALGEERIFGKTNYGVLSGQSDIYHNEGIEDHKVTSVFSFLLGVKDTWIAQLNVYKWLWEYNGFPVKSLKINAILRDWNRREAQRNPGTYPQIPFISMTAKMWNKFDVTDYISERFQLHKLRDVECTSEEKWERPTTYAVMKEGAKRANRVLHTMNEAKQYMDNITSKPDVKKSVKYNIEVRPGECVRCDNYCDVKLFCPYWKGV